MIALRQLYRMPDALRRADTLARACRSHHGRPPARLTYADARNATDEYIQAGNQEAAHRRSFAGEECLLGGSR